MSADEPVGGSVSATGRHFRGGQAGRRPRGRLDGASEPAAGAPGTAGRSGPNAGRRYGTPGYADEGRYARSGSMGIATAPQGSDPLRRPRGAYDRSGLVELALLALTLVTVLDLHRAFVGWQAAWLGPSLATAAGTFLTCRLTRRHVPVPLLGRALDLIAVVLLTIWTVIPRSTTYGAPAGHSLHTIAHAFDVLPATFERLNPPITPDTGFLLIATAGAGLVALLGSWLAIGARMTLLGTAPAFVGFLVCTVLGAEGGEIWSTMLEVAGVTTVLLVEHGTRPPPGRPIGPAPSGPGRHRGRAGAAAVVGVALIAAVVAGLAHSADGHGPLGWHEIDQTTNRVVPNPLVTMQAELLRQGNAKVFTYSAPAPTYTTLTTLNTFTDGNWEGNATSRGVRGSLPDALRLPGARVVTEHFSIQALDSPWLPLAFDPLTVGHAGTVSYDPVSGSLLTKHNTTSGLDYTITAEDDLATLTPKKLRSDIPLSEVPMPAGSLQLPAQVPSGIRLLGRDIVAGDRTEYDKALALQQYFHSSAFTYSLNPPADGSGINALTTFLLTTRTGYCQQFAGAYAVLARAVGLPTRLAIGFTDGTRLPDGSYQVTDANAHTWPEVWFPTYGWVPFEPTKGTAGSGFAIPGATGYTTNTASTPVARTITTKPGPQPTVPPTKPTKTGTTSPSTVAGAGSHPPAGILGRHLPHNLTGVGGVDGQTSTPTTKPYTYVAPKPPGEGSFGPDLLDLLVGLALAATLLAAGNEGIRRLRWLRRRRQAGRISNAARVRAAWDEVQESLRWHRLHRRPNETVPEMAARLAHQEQFDRRGPGRGRPIDELRHLADLMNRADFGPGVGDDDAAEAAADSREIRLALRMHATTGSRLRRLLDPRPAWSEPDGRRRDGRARVGNEDYAGRWSGEQRDRPGNPWASAAH